MFSREIISTSALNNKPRQIFSRQQQRVQQALTLCSRRRYQPTILPCHPRWISSSAVLLQNKRRTNFMQNPPAGLFLENEQKGFAQNPAVSINKKIICLGKKKNWEGILEIYEQEGAKFNNINFATTMSQLGRNTLLKKSHPVFSHFLEDLTNKMETRGLAWIGMQGASNIAHTIGKMKLSNVGAKRILDWMSEPEIATDIVTKGEPQTIANVAWAFARIRILPETFFDQVDKRAAWLVEKGEPQAVANTAWACGTLGIVAPNLFAEIDRQSKKFVNEGNPQTITNTAWACGKLGFRARNLFAEIDGHSKWLVKEGKPQEVANAAWACAKLDFDAPSLFTEIDQQSKWLVEIGKPQDVSSTAWSCGKLGFDAPNLFAEIDRNSKWLVNKGKPQDIANTAWAYGKLDFDAPNLFSEIDGLCNMLVREGTPQNVANTAWAFATLGFDAPNLFAEIEIRADDLLPQLVAQDVTNMCFAIAVSGRGKNFKGLLQKLWETAIQMSSGDFHRIELIQLAQTQLFAMADGVKLSNPPEHLISGMDQAIKQLGGNEVTSAHKEIAIILNELGLLCEFGVSPFISTSLGGLLALNLACKERKIAIEFNGPSRFLKELGSGKVTSTENGSTKAKRQFLQKLGWTIISIDYRDWNAARHAGNEKQWLEEKVHLHRLKDT